MLAALIATNMVTKVGNSIFVTSFNVYMKSLELSFEEIPRKNDCVIAELGKIMDMPGEVDGARVSFLSGFYGGTADG